MWTQKTCVLNIYLGAMIGCLGFVGIQYMKYAHIIQWAKGSISGSSFIPWIPEKTFKDEGNH